MDETLAEKERLIDFSYSIDSEYYGGITMTEKLEQKLFDMGFWRFDIQLIIKACKESGLVQLDENQEFPEIELPKTKYHLSVIIRYYLREQGFKRVKEIGE